MNSIVQNLTYLGVTPRGARILLARLPWSTMSDGVDSMALSGPRPDAERCGQLTPIWIRMENHKVDPKQLPGTVMVHDRLYKLGLRIL